MARVRVYVTDRDGNALGQIDSGRLGTISLELESADSVTISADPADLGELTLVDREIQVWIDDEPSPRLVGVPFTATRGLDARRVSIPILGLEAYLARWHVDEDLSYSGVDQLSIGAQILAWAQARPIDGADANIEPATFTLSGVTRTRDYYGDELPSVLEILNAFRGLDNGFDWTIEPVGPDRREWTPHYPRKGVVRHTWRLSFRDGRPGNVARLGYHLDGSQVTRRHHATSLGDGDGPDKLTGVYTDPTLGDGRILLESTSSESSSISDVATLVEHARARVEALRGRARTWETLVTDPEIAMGADLGDVLEVDLDDGWQAYAGPARIMAIRLEPVSERAILTLAEEDA